MRNLYSPSKLLTRKEFEKILKALEKSWSGESATFADVTKQWDKDNLPRGQCMITSLLINDLLGGRLVFDRVNHHYWNELPDKTWQDFTRSQYKDPTEFVVTKYRTKDEVLSDEYAVKHQSKDKYNLFKQKFQQVYTDLV